MPIWRPAVRSLLFLVMLTVGLGTVELLVWTLKSPGESRQDTVQASFMPVRLKANFDGRITGLPIKTNQYGFRDTEEYPPTPPPGEFRILGLGDSVAFGFGVSVRETFFRVAARRLAEFESRRIRVLNAAGQGYSPSSYFAYLANEGLALNPRLVIVSIELCNDVTDEALLRGPFPSAGDPTPRVRGGRYVVSWDGNLLGSAVLGPYPIERTYTYTFLLRRSLTGLHQWFPSHAVTSRPGVTYFHLGFDQFLLSHNAIERGWKRLFDALQVTRNLLASKGISMLLMVLPPRYLFEEGDSPYRSFSRGLVERASSMARDRDIPFRGFEEVLADAGGPALFADFAHLTPEGNRVVGEALADHLQASGLLDQ